VFPLHQIAMLGSARAEAHKLFGRQIIFELFQPAVWKSYLNVTDGRTDRLFTVA